MSIWNENALKLFRKVIVYFLQQQVLVFDMFYYETSLSYNNVFKKISVFLISELFY